MVFKTRSSDIKKQRHTILEKTPAQTDFLHNLYDNMIYWLVLKTYGEYDAYFFI